MYQSGKPVVDHMFEMIQPVDYLFIMLALSDGVVWGWECSAITLKKKEKRKSNKKVLFVFILSQKKCAAQQSSIL